MSYMILPINLVKQFDHYNLNMIPDFSTIHALTLNLMIKEGYYEKYVKKMHQIYGKKRETLITHLSNTFTNNIRIKDTRAGLHFIVEVNTPFSYQEIESRAKEMKLELYTLNRFSVKALEKNSSYKTLIIGFSKIKQEQIPQAVQRLKEVIWE